MRHSEFKKEIKKIGIVGINGTGKSTLLKMTAGEETPDKGQIIKQNGLKLAYAPQNPVFSEDSTIRSYALKKGEENWKVESNTDGIKYTPGLIRKSSIYQEAEKTGCACKNTVR